MKLLVTGAWNGAQEHFETLASMGHEVIWMLDERGALPDGAQMAQAVICNGLFLHHPEAGFEELRYVQLTSAGYDRVPLAALERRGITVHNARGVYSIPMAEFALCGVLQLYKQSRFFQQNQTDRRWEKHRGILELYGKTVCILGIGSVGRECAIRFGAFGCRVLGVNIRPRPVEHFDIVYPMEELNTALAMADIVVLAIPLTDETRHLINAERFQSMKSGAVLVNLARGAVVDTTALLDALDSHLGGAVLDVFEQEPLAADSPLWTKKNVLLTPHNSFVGEHNGDRLKRIILDNLEQFHENFDRFTEE